MRKLAPGRVAVAVAALCVSTALVVASAPAIGAPDDPGGDAGNGAADPERTLAEAVRLLRPSVFGRMMVGQGRRDATLVLRDLHEHLPELTDDEQQLAESLLARPTDRGRDPGGFGYTTKDVARKCADKVCLHWPRKTRDRPPNRKWALRSLRTLRNVYDFEVTKLGFRRPVADGTLGGNPKLDVYLKDLGAGLYGYCAPEYYKRGSKKVASAYCVIDNDFARSQFAGRPGRNLRVTLAHEFFHAVQFAYDVADDRWIYESTATWMEEQFADDVNDNRQYLRLGQIGEPRRPLDTFDDTGAAYGNWAWWEFLSQRYGRKIVRRVWERMDSNKGEPRDYSTKAMRKALRRHGGFGKAYAAFATRNVTPAKAYPEGRRWPSPEVARVKRLSTGHRKRTARLKIDHMASRTVRVTPGRTLRKGWKLKVRVNAPDRVTAPHARLVIRRPSGKVVRRPITLNQNGYGRAQLPFTRRLVRHVTVVLVNSSTRFRCWDGTDWTCRGRPADDDRKFVVKTAVVK